MTDRAASTAATGVAWLHAAHQLVDDPVIVRLMGATRDGGRLGHEDGTIDPSSARLKRAPG